ncbi:unnamed protein product, partial [Brassica rapa]
HPNAASLVARRSSWHTLPPRWNFTYQFQVEDQIGSFYSPLLNFQRASAKFGHVVLRILLDYGKELGMPDGVPIMDSFLTSTANAAALDKKPGVCCDCQGIGPVLNELHSLSLLNSNYIYMITLRKITSSYVKSQSHNDSLFPFDMLQKPHELDIDALMCLYD